MTTKGKLITGFIKKLLVVFGAAVIIGQPVFASSPYLGGNTGVTSVTPGVTASSLGKAEDAAHTSGDVGVAGLAVQSTTLSGLGGTTGDYVPLQVNASGALYVQQVPNTTGGLTIFRSIDLDESEEEVKATAGQLYFIDIYNNDASAEMFVKFYNATAANVTVGTTAPVMTIPCPASTHCQIAPPAGIAFDTAISAAATGAIADNDTTAPDANDVVVNILYK